MPLSPRTLERWRLTGEGPAFVRYGGGSRGRVFYLRSDLDEWIKSHRRQSTSDPGGDNRSHELN